MRALDDHTLVGPCPPSNHKPLSNAWRFFLPATALDVAPNSLNVIHIHGIAFQSVDWFHCPNYSRGREHG